jgi:ATP-dependent RNA circularization protein (DNA/RNA ligase family)
MSKYGRTYHLPWSPGATNDDRISNSVDSLLGKEIVITEKLDGENCGMTDDGVFARSHATFTTSTWSREVRAIHKLKVENELGDGVYLFGENMEGIHSIEYTNLTSYFYIFGLRDNNIWVPWEKVEEYSYLLDIPTVPVLFKGIVNTEKELKELTERLSSEPSELGGQREGIVVRNADMFHNDDFAENVMKWVRKCHVQTTAHWTRNWTKCKITPM